MGKNFKPLEKTSASLFDALKPEKDGATVAMQNVEGDETVAKRLSVWAIVAVVSGFFSFFSLINLGFLAFSAFAAFAAIWALTTISRSGGEMVGKSFARTGLALAIAGAFAGPIRAETFKAEYERQADACCRTWFDAAFRGDYLSLRLMELPYWDRPAILDRGEEAAYWKKFVNEEERHFGFHQFMTNPTLLAASALGDRAKASFYKTSFLFLGTTMETTTRVYAVTVEPKPGTNDKKQTFFIELHVGRNVKVTAEGERFVGWTVRMDDWAPLELDADGRPISSEDKNKE